MNKFISVIFCFVLGFLLTSCSANTSGSANSKTPYNGAPKIVLDGNDYFAPDLDILNELPEGYIYAGELTDEEKQYADIDGSQYYILDGAEEIDDFYVYQECGTPVSDSEVDNAQRQWAYVKWSKQD
jgi:hypothetical protein